MLVEPAVFSEDRRFRYVPTRQVSLLSCKVVLFIMLNPSTADEWKDDPTIRRGMGFASLWGFGWFVACNLFALRSTDPRRLYQADDAAGPENDMHILGAAQESDLTVCAWGNHGQLHGRGVQVVQMLQSQGIKLHHLGLTKVGQPKHPLYLPKTTPLAIIQGKP